MGIRIKGPGKVENTFAGKRCPGNSDNAQFWHILPVDDPDGMIGFIDDKQVIEGIGLENLQRIDRQ